MASQLVFKTKLCLPSASHGPFGSMPPVEMITVVLPAFIASRTSIQVISSSQTVLGGVSGFGVSMQLYGFSEHCPPPAVWKTSARSPLNAPSMPQYWLTDCAA